MTRFDDLRRFYNAGRRVHSKAVGGPDSLTELVFLMVILKIPIVYLCGVIYHAIKAEPHTGELEPVRVRVSPDDPPPGFDRFGRRSRRRPRRPHGGPSQGGPARAYARTHAGSVAGKAGVARRKTEGRLRRPSGRAAYARADRVGRG